MLHFKGYASVFNVIDLDGDIVEPGAFKEQLQEANRFPLLWAHNRDKIIGNVYDLVEDDKGLFLHGEVFDKDKIDEMKQLKQNRMILGLSIGFSAIRYSCENDKKSLLLLKRTLHQVNLFEVSIATFPACQETLGIIY